jgi:hypothetical protein
VHFYELATTRPRGSANGTASPKTDAVRPNVSISVAYVLAARK